MAIVMSASCLELVASPIHSIRLMIRLVRTKLMVTRMKEIPAYISLL